MTIGRVNVGVWLLKILTWDAALPAAVAFTPVALESLFPNRRGLVEIAAVLLPMAAFLVRLRVGLRHFAANRSPAALRGIQLVAFFVGILILVLAECAFILTGIMPKGTLFATQFDRQVWAGLLITYLAAMAVAMYPGRSAPAPAEDDAWGLAPSWGGQPDV